MGIYIKGMEMPKAGNWKTIRIYNDGTCAEPNWQGDCKYIQGCEAVPVPPHGRLIDADAELKKLNRICLPDDLSYTIGHDIAKQFLKDAHTIIPAEEESNG